MIVITKNSESIKDYLEYTNNTYLENLEFNEKTAIILGNFDGVHLGHLKIIKEAVEKAHKNNLKVLLYTFIEFPLKKDTVITSLSEKLYIFSKLNIDYVYLEDFNNIKNYLPKDFVDNILIKKLNAKKIFCGFNYTFGINKLGNVQYLIDNYKNILDINISSPIIYNFSNDEIFEIKYSELEKYEKNNCKLISSTLIREYIKNGDIKIVNKLLSHNYFFIGEVIHGKKLGRLLGFPTANLKSDCRTFPRFGVYGCKIYFKEDNKEYFGIMNVGKNPTVSNENIHIEANIFDFNKEIYGQYIKIELLENIRLEKKMKSLEELKIQINKDKEKWSKTIYEKYIRD